MKAELLPLNGKYYGTRVFVSAATLHNNGESLPVNTVIEIWTGSSTWIPSERELAYCVSQGYDEPDFEGGHYESALSLEIAQKILAALNQE